MKFTLKDYQEGAVRDVLDNLRKARKRWVEDKDKHAFSLTAPTGAGKTVMAAAVFEALFHGDDYYEFDADHGAIVIWFSDDPSLNEQTRFRLMECADRLRHTDLVVVENTFNRERFEPGKVYFLNTQKLGKKSLLVRGFDGEDGDGGMFPELRPDMHSFTIWDTIRNTIEDPSLRLYLVLDEAHRGMGNPSTATQNEKSTIVKRLINGENGVPGIPIVLGISATADRFNKAMEGAKGRIILPSVTVDTVEVRESGLLKDTIALDVPAEAGHFDSVLLRRATDKLKDSTLQWTDYAKEQGAAENAVVPLMVLQVPNTPNLNEVGKALETIFEQWRDLPEDCVAHVFGEHTLQKFGKYVVPHISPERVQDETWVRILVAKDAISTGWDCPRAEVMISFRHSTDQTHITQLLGRMVRTPLARRIPGNERLNSVDCLLPFFDEPTVNAVVKALVQGSADTPPLGRILINPKDMMPNPAVTEKLWEKFASLPSQTRPQRGAKPSIRLAALAQELVLDGLLPDAGARAHAAMHKVLDQFIATRLPEFAAKRNAVLTVEGKTVFGDMQKMETKTGEFRAEADTVVIDDAYRRSARILSPDIARTYTEELAKRKPGAEHDFEDALLEAREDVGALGLMENLQNLFDAEAKKLSDLWLSEYKNKIKVLSDERQEAYRQITALSHEPQDVDLARPTSRMEATSVREKNGAEFTFPTYKKHLLCDENGLYPADLNDWEVAVLKTEMQRPDFRFWYRNPERPSQDSLGIAYDDGSTTKIMRPDFLFFVELPDGEIATDIVDPHGLQFADSLPKLQGFARYADAHAKDFRRIEAVAEVGGKLRVLDLTKADTRDAIATAADAITLYSGMVARDYK
jgi:hypothetical protein